MIEEPVAAGGLDTDAIAIYPSPTEVKYYAGARWTERAPKMIQTLLVESFENSGKITAVGRQAIGLYSDYNLKTELREFQSEQFRRSKMQRPGSGYGSMPRSSSNRARKSSPRETSKVR